MLVEQVYFDISLHRKYKINVTFHPVYYAVVCGFNNATVTMLLFINVVIIIIMVTLKEKIPEELRQHLQDA